MGIARKSERSFGFSLFSYAQSIKLSLISLTKVYTLLNQYNLYQHFTGAKNQSQGLFASIVKHKISGSSTSNLPLILGYYLNLKSIIKLQIL